MSLKLELACSVCKKIYTKPIVLPCGDTICQEHLKEKSVIKQNKFQCKVCSQEFNLNENQLTRPNKLVDNLLEKEMYLNNEEKALKQLIEESFKTLHQLNENVQESTQNRRSTRGVKGENR